MVIEFVDIHVALLLQGGWSPLTIASEKGAS